MKQAAVFSCLGLGDGLISLVLSHNLLLNGVRVTTFHPFLSSLQSWFPLLPIRPFPKEVPSVLNQFDRFFLFVEKSSWMQEVMAECIKNHRPQTTILNPIATPNQDYPYWEEGRFNGEKPLVDNLYAFSKDVLKFNISTKSNAITPPEGLVHRKQRRRVLLHPSASRATKSWSKHKFLALGKALEKEGYLPRFILTENERIGWELNDEYAPRFANLNEVASYVYESGSLIGNDSGMGHLASCLGVPTLTICRNRHSTQFWRPAWAKGALVYPSPWIPNLKGLRLRDQYWQAWVSVERVFSAFHELSELGH